MPSLHLLSPSVPTPSPHLASSRCTLLGGTSSILRTFRAGPVKKDTLYIPSKILNLISTCQSNLQLWCNLICIELSGEKCHVRNINLIKSSENISYSIIHFIKYAIKECTYLKILQKLRFSSKKIIGILNSCYDQTNLKM